MIRLALALTRAGGWPRMLLVASCTSIVSGLLLVAIALLRLPAQPEEHLFMLVEDPGTRGGTAFATAVLVLPVLLLLYQVIRLGTTARERRLAALHLAGCTPGEVRRLGALEVGTPALVGSVAGIALYGLLRVVLGGSAMSEPFDPSGALQLVPTTVAPTWWQALLVVAAVTLAGVAVGLRTSRTVMASPYGVSRRQPSRPPWPWGLLMLVAAVVAAPIAFAAGHASTVTALIAIGLALLGVVSLAPWAAYRAGRFTERRATSPALLLAARRLVTDPRPAGRAAAAVGGIALVSGGAAALAAELVANEQVESFYVLSLALVAMALLGALLVVTGTVALHTTESLLDRKRSIASLVALGMPAHELERSQRWEAALVAVPMATAGVVLGSTALLGLGDTLSVVGVLIILANVVLTPSLVWTAITIAVRVTRPWAIRAGAPANLRTA